MNKRSPWLIWLLSGLFVAIAVLAFLKSFGKQRLESPEEEHLKRRIDALSEQRFGWMSFGTPEPWPTEDVEYIVGKGRQAVPFLVAALNSDDLVKVGYAAYCLQLMKSTEGLDSARKRLATIPGAVELNWKQAFARNCLEDYLELDR